MSLSPVTKGLLYLFCALSLTYYAKTHTSELIPVRVHGLIGWSLVKQNGNLASLLVFPDDDQDNNLTKTGNRLWIDLPDNPDVLKKSFIKFSGPKMVILGDSLKIDAIHQASLDVDSAGTLWIFGKANPTAEELKKTITHLYLYTDSVYLDAQISTPSVKVTTSKEHLSITYAGLYLCYALSSCKDPEKWSLITWIKSPQNIFQQQTPQISFGSDTTTEHMLFLPSIKYAAGFYESNGILKLQKVNLK